VNRSPSQGHAQAGFTLVELLLAMVLAAILIVGLSGVTGQILDTRDHVTDRNELNRQARFAMDQMVRMVGHTRLLLLPLADKTPTTFVENIREQTIPASAPPPGSTFATAVLAVTLPATFDLDGDGIPDADNDGDGRFDEDLPADVTHDNKPGIAGIDDDGAGYVDYSFSPITDDDESADFSSDEDPLNGIDDDGDGIVDEDPSADINGDACPGICGVDDDGDNNVDEGGINDDDEDGRTDEDWYDPVVFYLNADTLMRRTPVPWDESGGGVVTGLDFITSVIAENVTRFRVERLPAMAGGVQLVDLTLELTSPDSSETVSLQTRVRVGGAL